MAVRVLGRTAAVLLMAVVVVGAGGAAPAGAQPPEVDLHPGLELTLAREAGKSGQRDARLSGWIDHRGTDGYEGPLVIGGSLTLPRGISFHGDAVPRCSATSIRDEQGTASCPRRSIVGRGAGRGRAFDDAAIAVEDGFTDPDYEFVNGGRRRIWAVMTVYNPALFVEPMALELRRTGRAGSPYRIDFRIPAILRVIAGVPINVRTLDLMLDGIERAPGYLAFDGSCPKRHRLPYRASLTFEHGDGTISESSRRGRLACRVERAT